MKKQKLNLKLGKNFTELKISSFSAILSIIVLLMSGFQIILLFQLGITKTTADAMSISPIIERNINTALQSTFANFGEDIKTALVNKAIEEAIYHETASVRAFFQNYGSPMQGYEEIIVRQARACGGDYRILVGIAGNESGLGKIPYRVYNPFGYLDSMDYSGWEQSLTKLSCVISQRFIAPCQGDLWCIVNRYAGPQDDKELWVRNVSWFMSQV